MKKQYTMTGEDVAILKRRVPYPCTSERCSRGQAPNDYGYCGCGYEAHCDRKHIYECWCVDAKAAGLWEIAQSLLLIDKKKQEQAKLQENILAEVAKIGSTYGTKILQLLSDNLYDGQL